MAAIQIAFTDPATGMSYPHALVTISNWLIQGDPPAAQVDLTFYGDASAFAQLLPLRKRTGVVLTPAEIQTWIQQFALAGYQTLLARPEFQGGQIVP